MSAAYVVVCVVALIASFLTLFSGFGLGSLLLPAFVLFFPVEVAVSATAVVHLLNNLFKLAIVGRHAKRRVVVAFGIPALGGAVLGAWILTYLANLPVVTTYSIGSSGFQITWVKLIVAVLILLFSGLELLPDSRQFAVGPSFLPLGGVLSGFFGGLSGHQGALRSVFLLRAGLSKEAFVGSGVVCAAMVDVARLTVYGVTVSFGGMGRDGAWGLVVAGSASAFAGAWFGTRALKKVTLGGVRRGVALLLIVLAVALGLGLV